MTNARQSPIPQDRVNANVNSDERAATDQARMAEQERHLEDQGVDELAGRDADAQPAIPDEPASPAEGGD